LPKGWKPEDIDYEKAMALISLPRDIGKHPESGKMISAGLGRYGPFLMHDGGYANLESIEDVFSIGLNRAVTVIAEKKAAPGRGRASTPAALKSLGDHPDGGAITVRDGRFGPYVNWGKVNATIPKAQAPDTVTLDEALVLIAERIAKTGTGNNGKPVKAKKAAAPKKAAKAESADGETKAKAKPKTAAKTKAAAKPKTSAKPKAAPKAKKAES
jgi:DNA topoisomerase-1